TGTPIQKVMAHVEKKPQPLTELRQDIPEGLMPVLERMMAKKPKRRYQTPIEVANALERFTRPSASDAGRSRTLVLERPPAYHLNRRRTVAFAAALWFAVAVLLGGAVYRIATDKGELVITTESDDVEVVVKQGGELVRIIDTKTEKSITLRSGVYELELKDAPARLKLDVEKATLRRGEKTLATIERLPNTRPAHAAAPNVVDEIVPLHRIQFSEGSRFGTADISPDGRYFLATRIDADKLRIWEVKTGKLVRELRESVAHFTPDSR